MQYEIEVGGRLRQVAVTRHNGDFVVSVDGRTFQVQAARVDAHTLSLLLEGGASHEVTFAAVPALPTVAVRVDDTPVQVLINPRRARGGPAGPAGGVQRLVAPMPGKVVRVLVKTGDNVKARQPLVVVEAMKMENELRATADGVVTELQAKEGMSVDAGAALAVIEPDTR